MFQQFYKEFTASLLNDFYSGDKLRLKNLRPKDQIKVESGDAM